MLAPARDVVANCSHQGYSRRLVPGPLTRPVSEARGDSPLSFGVRLRPIHLSVHGLENLHAGDVIADQSRVGLVNPLAGGVVAVRKPRRVDCFPRLALRQRVGMSRVTVYGSSRTPVGPMPRVACALSTCLRSLSMISCGEGSAAAPRQLSGAGLSVGRPGRFSATHVAVLPRVRSKVHEPRPITIRDPPGSRAVGWRPSGAVQAYPGWPTGSLPAVASPTRLSHVECGVGGCPRRALTVAPPTSWTRSVWSYARRPLSPSTRSTWAQWRSPG